MSRRMNYGPRFRPTITSNKYVYDEAVAKAMRPAGWMLGMTYQQRAFNAAKCHAKRNKDKVGMPTFS